MIGHDTILTAGCIALAFAVVLAWRAADRMAAAIRHEAEARRLEAEAGRIAKAMLEAFALWNYGARDEAIAAIRDAGIKIEERG